MFDLEGKRSLLSLFGQYRRRFLARAGLASVATPLSLFALAEDQRSGHPTSFSASNCADARIPMREVGGKVAFITGGSSGIGLGIARAFIAAGMKVVVTYRTQAHIDEAMKYFEDAKDRIHAINVDVTDRPGMEKAAAETVDVFGKVHVLVNNAGVVLPVPLNRTTYNDWDWVIGVNLTGVFNGVHSFLPRIQAHGEGGQIISTSSIFGLFAPEGVGAYSPSKFGVVGMMEQLRWELTDANIGVSVYCPGPVLPMEMDSSRSRPSRLSDSGFKPDAQMIAKEREDRNGPKVQADALEAGRLVLRGMCNNDLYILTHGEYGPLLRLRNEVLMASNPTVHPTADELSWVRTYSKGYAIERDRKLCPVSTAKVIKRTR
jgi:NAD(P)-dependent dehydrogenase (short-subunit alcohol dehydrogenase family)